MTDIGWPAAAAVPVTNAIVGIDLANRKQVVVVTVHRSHPAVGVRRRDGCHRSNLLGHLKAGSFGSSAASQPSDLPLGERKIQMAAGHAIWGQVRLPRTRSTAAGRVGLYC